MRDGDGVFGISGAKAYTERGSVFFVMLEVVMELTVSEWLFVWFLI